METLETLQQIWQRLKDNGYETDKGSVHSYIPVYEQLFEQYRHTALNVLEIGLFNGHSMRMWSEYFTKAKIYGVDCSETPVDGLGDLRLILKEINSVTSGEPKMRIDIFDAEDENEVYQRIKHIKFDIIIEDAGHEINQQLNLFKIWSKYLVDDGLYIIEDIQDIDRDRERFEELLPGQGMTIFDYRHSDKQRYDDVMIVIRKKYS